MNNKQMIQQLYNAYARHDHGVIRRIFDPRIAQPGAPNFPAAGTYITIPAILHDVYGPYANKWHDFRLMVRDFVDKGDEVIVVGMYIGCDPETGLELRAEFAHTYMLQNRRVVSFTQHVEQACVAMMAS